MDYVWPIVGILAALSAGLLLFISIKLGGYWIQAYMSDARISMKSLVLMTLLKLDIRMIVNATIIAKQSGVDFHREGKRSVAYRLQTHLLSGGNVMDVVTSLILAERAGIALDFERAAAVDLTGRDILTAIRLSVSPKVIQCPQKAIDEGLSISAIAKDGIELKVRAQITVRTNLDQLVGGATDETIVARVGQGIISVVGSADRYMDILAKPSKISDFLIARGLDQGTAYTIVSIDIADITVGENIGAELAVAQAKADMRTALAYAEGRRSEALATLQQMRARVAEKQADVVRSESFIPLAIADSLAGMKLAYAYAGDD